MKKINKTLLRVGMWKSTTEADLEILSYC